MFACVACLPRDNKKRKLVLNGFCIAVVTKGTDRVLGEREEG